MVVQSTGVSTVAVTITNVTPENNSTISSFTINKPYSGATLTPLSSSATATVLPDGNGNVNVNAFQGLKSGGRTPNNITINLTVDYGAAGPPVCGSNASWTATVYTGNFSNTTFQLVDANGNNLNSVLQSLNCYSLSGLPTTIKAGTTTSANVTVKNESAAGGPTLNRLELTLPSGMTISPNPSTNLDLSPGATTTVAVFGQRTLRGLGRKLGFHGQFGQ